MKVLLIRHGMTEGNRFRRYIGSTDEPLCPEGVRRLRALKEQARDAGRDYEAQMVFVSPMLRCTQTAEILFEGAGMILVPQFREMDFGIFEGRAWKDDLEYDPEYLKWLETDCEGVIPGGEWRQGFADRCVAGFRRAMELAMQESGCREIETVAFVVHGGTVMAILSECGEEQGDFYSWMTDNGHGYAGEWDGSKISGIYRI